MIGVYIHEHKIGEIFNSCHPMEAWKLNREYQPVKAVRKSSREEFINYWLKEDPIGFNTCKEMIGFLPPETSYYYEISTD